MKKNKYKKRGKLILGINGWFDRCHDSSAALIDADDEKVEILGALEEEKVRGQKNVYDVFPTNSIRYLLEMFELTPEDIDEIAFGWDYPYMYKELNKDFPFKDNELLAELFSECSISKNIHITFVNHHKSHASACFRTSPFDEAIVVVIDGNGESEATSIWTSKKNKLIKLSALSPESSYGFLFEAANLMIGFEGHESGKTMGLAAYGKPVYYEELRKYYDSNLEMNDEFRKRYETIIRFCDTTVLSYWQEAVVRTWMSIFQSNLHIKLRKDPILSFYECDEDLKNLAASIQYLLEQNVKELVAKTIRETNIHNVCVAGGVALNCTMNGKILALEEVKDIYVQPAAGDSGVSLGAAFEIANERGLCSKLEEHFTPYLGCEWDDNEVIEGLKKRNQNFICIDDASEYVGKMIADNKVIALFQGRNEWGPRALGNRSIISNAKKGKLDHINKNVKHRELGRPLAPSMVQDDCKVLNEKHKSFGKFMNIAYVTVENDDNFCSIIHFDGSYRAQFVTESMNEYYYSQLQAVKEKNGNSIVINTSFNNKTPIIFTVDQAVDFFEDKSIDAIVFNNRIILLSVS